MNDHLGPLARELRSLRAEQEVEQLDLAVAVGAGDGSYLSKLENGRATNPSAAFLARYVAGYRMLGRPLTAEQRQRLMAAALGQGERANTPSS
jgi:transcriptional regulator with XRE-family HTH domain